MADEPDEGVRVGADALSRFVVDVLAGAGLGTDAAEVVADNLVDANLRGVDTHGVVRLEQYVTRLEAGGINPAPEVTVAETGAATAVVDADDGPGQVATLRATEEAVDRARDAGAAFVGVRNSNHYGTAAYFTNYAAERGCIGINMTHTGPNVVPFGGADPFFGTNPIAISVPGGDLGFPVALDMATSVTAKGSVVLAAEEGEDIPPEWAVDESGEPTTDPEEFHALRPVGGPKGYKGYGLAFMVDVFCGVLLDTAVGDDVATLYTDEEEPQDLGHVVAAVDVEAFTDADGFDSRLDRLVERLKSVRTADGRDEVLVPGEPEARTAAERRADGVPLGDGVWGTLAGLSDRYEVDLPEAERL